MTPHPCISTPSLSVESLEFLFFLSLFTTSLPEATVPAWIAGTCTIKALRLLLYVPSQSVPWRCCFSIVGNSTVSPLALALAQCFGLQVILGAIFDSAVLNRLRIVVENLLAYDDVPQFDRLFHSPSDSELQHVGWIPTIHERAGEPLRW